MAELNKEWGECKCDNVQLDRTGHVIESKGHIDGKYYFDTNGTDFTEHHYNLMEPEMSEDDTVWYSGHPKVSGLQSYLQAAKNNTSNVIDNNKYPSNASGWDMKEVMQNPTPTNEIDTNIH